MQSERIEKAASEVKLFLDGKKFDLVDYGYVDIEAYPDPTSEEYSELKKMADEWYSFYNQTDKVVGAISEEMLEEMRKSASGGDVMTDILKNSAPDLAQLYEQLKADLASVAQAVTSDAKYWEELRKVIIPLYEKSPHYEAWKERWKGIELAYDPIGQETTTTKMFTNKVTGERTRGEVVRRTVRPEGFIVRIL
jgi:hypothetical protein